MQGGQKAERLAPERRRTLRDVRARTVPRLHHAHRGERAQADPHRRPADADLRRQLTFGGQPVARAQRAALDEVADVRDDLLGAALRSRARPAGCGGGRPSGWRSYLLGFPLVNRPERANVGRRPGIAANQVDLCKLL